MSFPINFSYKNKSCFYWTNLHEISLRSTKNMPRFSAFLMTCKQARISCVDICLGIFCASFFTFKPKRNYPRTRTNSVQLGTTWQFYLLIQFRCRFQRQDQPQRSSFLDNKMLHSDRSFINFRFQSLGCKPGSETFQKCRATHSR